MAQFQTAAKIHSFSVKYNFPTMEGRIQTLVSCDLAAIRALYPSLQGEAWTNGFLKELKVYGEINSLDEAPFPELSDSLSESERLAAVLNVEWGSPRYHFCLWSTTVPNPSNVVSDGQWNLEGKHSLLNSFGYPYRIYYPFDLLTNNLAREFAEGCKFGFSIEDVGYGYPVTDISPFDIVTVSGNWSQELVVITPDTPATTIYYQTGGDGGTPVASPYIAGLPVTLKTITKPTLAFTVSNITPGTFTYDLLKDGVSIFNSTGNTLTNTATINIDFSTITAGNGTYKLVFTQGTTVVESGTFNVAFPTATPNQTTYTKNQSAIIRLAGLVSGQILNYQQQKFTNNQWTGLSISGTGTIIYAPTGSNDYWDWSYSLNNPYETYPRTYRWRIYRDGLVDFYTPQVTVNP